MNAIHKSLIRPAVLVFTCILFQFFGIAVWAQNNADLKISIQLDHENWVYKPGEKARFTVSVSSAETASTPIKLKYEVGPEKMKPYKVDSVSLTNNSFIVDNYTLSSPGFLRLVVSTQWKGKTVRALATAAYSAEQIIPTIPFPAAFNDFWKGHLQKLAKVPVDAKMELLKELSTEQLNVYQVSLQNIHNSKVFGILSVPRKEGKYPAILKVPGAGVRGYKGDTRLAEQGVITLEIGIHGVPVTLNPEVYTNLAGGALYGYNSINLDQKDNYYYNRVYLGCVRAVDFLVSLPEYDGKHLGVYGGSQGGALSIVTAALDPRIQFLGAYYPALSDLTGYTHQRAGGWPHLFNDANWAKNPMKEKLETAQYYDVVNFAKQLKVPGYYSWGYNDETCPPTSMYSAYNVITAPKQLAIFKETGHFTVPEQTQAMLNWLVSKMK